MKRVCKIPGCPHIQDGHYCDEHSKEREGRRGSARQRGYDAAHDKERARIKRAGIHNFHCARCKVQFGRDEPFQLGHTDDRKAWSGPEHIRCNTSAAGKASHQVRHAD